MALKRLLQLCDQQNNSASNIIPELNLISAYYKFNFFVDERHNHLTSEFTFGKFCEKLNHLQNERTNLQVVVNMESRISALFLLGKA